MSNCQFFACTLKGPSSVVDYEGRNYKRLFFLGDKLVGAMLIGKMKGRKKVLELISSRTPIDRREMVLEMLAMPEVTPKPATGA